ncbi:MAG: hypothetical protein LAP40_00940 [Acidobacteriia bacterium]|nr:hypothetical protein [Terriglobia bacterium]
MKGWQIGLLVAVAAVGGALVMKVTQPSQPAAPAPVVAQHQTPAPNQTQAPAAAVQPAPAEPEAKPVPVIEHKTKPKPVRHPQESQPGPVAVAPAAPPPAVVPPAPQPVAEVPPPARPEPESAPPPPPPPPQVTLNAGMSIPVRLIDGLSTERNNSGDLFTGSLDQPLVVDGLVIAERGARVEGRVVLSDRGGKVKGVSSLVVDLTRIHLSDGQTISVQTENFEKQAEASKKEDAAKVGAGAAIGAIIGAIAGGGKGAAVGAGVGGGAGAGDVLLTRGKPATLPSETRITFRLSAPITVTERQQ